MKKLLLTCGALVVSLVMLAQNVTLDYTNTALKTVFASIEKQTGWTISYAQPVVNPNQKVSIQVANVPVTDALDQLFANTNIVYKVDGTSVLLNAKSAAKKIQAQGVVLDAAGEPAIGASVQVKGTTNGTITDFDGKFSVEASSEDLLVFSYVGFKSQELKAASNMKVALVEENEILNDVVVIGYGAVRKSDLTGAVASIKTEELNQTTATLEQALIGHTPGVEIKQTSGAPGSEATIHIRGVNSVYGGVEPLYVIDGYPASKDAFINPSDVASIEVLKDAASAAIYGSRAGGGVVLITTKRGQEGKPTIQVDYQFSMQQLQKKIQMMNADEFKQLHKDGYNNSYFDYLRNNPGIYGNDDNVNWWHSRNDNNDTRLDNGATQASMCLSPDIVDSNYDTDWQNEVFSNAPMHKVNFSVNGGKDNFKYMFSVGYLNQDGIIKPGNHQRLTTRLNMDIDVTKHFSVGVNTNMYYVKERVVRTDGLAFNDGVILNTLGMPPTYACYNADGSYNLGMSYRNSAYGTFGGENPVAIANERQENYKKMRASLNTNLKYTFLDGFYFNLSGGFQIADQIYNLYRPSSLGQSGTAPGDINYSGVVAKDNRDFNTDWLLEATLNLNRVFKQKHMVNAVLGYSMQKKVYSNIDANSVTGALKDDRITELSAAKATETDENGTQAKTDKAAWSLMSFFGRAMYTYDQRYTISLTMRGDGCSRFGSTNRWGYFPSVSAGWNITNEPWAVDAQQYVTAKLRASWGLSGNNNISNYRHIATISQGTYVYGDPSLVYTTYYPTSVDSDLGWEKTSQTNAGFDMTFLNGRIGLVANYYYSVTSDLLYQATTSATQGATSMWTNLKDGKVYNQGFDIALDANVLKLAGVKWNIGVNFSLNRNKVEGLLDEITVKAQRSQLTHITRNGEPIGSYYGMVSDGLISVSDYQLIKEDAQHQGEEGYVLKGPAVADYANVYVGDVKWKDVNGDGKITEDDRDIIGNNYPKFTYGFNTSLTWKGLAFSCTFDGSYGNKVINFSRYYICNNEGGVNTMIQGVNRYRGEALNEYETNSTMMFRANRSQKNLNTKFSDYFVEDASFLRMTNIMIGYTFDDKKLQVAHIDKINIYFAVDNVFTVTPYTGYNPDVDYNASTTAPGIDFGTYPLSRSYSCGIKLTL